jgi:hypothetical protein
MHGALIHLSGAAGLAFSRCSWNQPPFSVKAFGKLEDLLDKAGEDRITVKVRLQSQPWHMYSGVIVRCILAASTLEGGKTAAKSVMAAVAAHREEFEFDRHCSGPNLDATPNDIIRRIERYSAVKLAEAFAIPDLDRQNAIHVSPTFMVDGLVQPDMSSGDPVADFGSLTPGSVQEARSAIAWLYRFFAERGNQTPPSGKNLPPSMPVPNLPLDPRPEFEQRDRGGAAPA